MAQSTGTVKWYSEEKGYGFIQHEGEDVYFRKEHIDGARKLAEGQRVEFTAKKGPKGLQAEVVKAV